MAKLKNISALAYYPNQSDSDTYQPNLFQTHSNNTNVAFAEDENNSILYINGTAHDSTSLVPYFEKDCLAYSQFKKNNFNYYTAHALNTRYDQATAVHDDYIASGPYVYNIFQHIYEPAKFQNLAESINSSSTKVIEHNGDTYTFMLTPEHDGDGAYSGDAEKITIVKGDDLSNPQASTTSDQIKTIVSSYYATNFSILHIDIENRTIYLNSTRSYDSRGGYPYLHYVLPSLYTVTFSLPEDGVFACNNDMTLLFYSGEQSTGTTPLKTSLLYLGLDSYSNHIFCTINYSADPLVLEFNVVNNSTGAPSVVRSFSLTVPDTYQNNWIHIYPSSFVYNSETLYHETFLPFQNASGVYQPLLLNWDKTLDSSLSTTTPFSLQEIQTGTSSLNYDQNLISSISSPFRLSANLKTIHTTLNGVEYLTLLPSFKTRLLAQNVANTITDAMYIASFRIDRDLSGVPSLVFLSKTETSCHDYFLTTNKSVINMIDSNGLAFYSLTPSGWVKTSTELGVFTSMTVDSFNRIWALEIAGKQLSQISDRHIYESGPVIDPGLKLHLITKSIAYSTTVSFGTTGQEYNGVTLNNTILVSAYDNLGQRLSTEVVVSIEGSNMTFADGSTSINTTTSAIQETSLPVLITGPGYINVTASFSI